MFIFIFHLFSPREEALTNIPHILNLAVLYFPFPESLHFWFEFIKECVTSSAKLSLHLVCFLFKHLMVPFSMCHTLFFSLTTCLTGSEVSVFCFHS